MMYIVISVLHKYMYVHIYKETNAGRKYDSNSINCTVVISGDVIVGDFSFLFTCNF